MHRIAILAYGSLIKDPGLEIRKIEVDRSPFLTCFPVEFAHESGGRDGAPTLVPVDTGGSKVQAKLIALREGTELQEARNILYRREINEVCQTSREYDPKANTGKDSKVWVKELESVPGFDVVLYTQIKAELEDATVQGLAKLAIKSAEQRAGKDRRDGISYLKNALDAGIGTPKAEAYRQAILERMETETLDEAWCKCRATAED